MSRSAMHKYTTCTSFDYSHSTMQYDTWGVVCITVQKYTLFKSKLFELLKFSIVFHGTSKHALIIQEHIKRQLKNPFTH